MNIDSKILSQKINFGNYEGKEPQLQRRILFSNVIYITLTFVYLIYFLLVIEVYLRSPFSLKLDQWSVPLIIIYCIGGLFLNSIDRSYISRISFLVLWPLLLHVLPIIYMETPSDYYIAYPLGLILHAIFIQFFISFRHEPKTFWIFIVTNFIAILFARQFLLSHDHNSTIILQEGVVSSGYYSLILLLYWLLFNFMTFYILKVVDDLIDKTSGQRELMMKSNEELSALLNHVQATNLALEQTLSHHKSEVEEVVSAYAQYNAHTIRGPYCRLKGILMLNEISALEDDFFKKNLQTTMVELEMAINRMQDELNGKIQQLSIFEEEQN